MGHPRSHLLQHLPTTFSHGGISWEDSEERLKYVLVEHVTDMSPENGWEYMSISAFAVPEPKDGGAPAWIVEVAVKHRDRNWLFTHDFRNLFSAESIYW